MARKQTREPAMIGQIRDAIRDSGLSLSELSRQSGVSHPQLSRFVNGQRTLTLPAAARVCEALGLALGKAGGAGESAPAKRRKAKGE